MTIEELSQYTINEVLNNQHLINVFKDLYKSKHGVTPTCTSCAIANEFRKLIESQNKLVIMSKEFIYKSPKGEILTYINKDGKRIRCYDTNLNIDFVTGYLSVNKYNTIEEVESRKALFKTLPVITSNEVKQDVIKEENIETVNPVEENIEVVKPVKKKTTSRKKK
ncbi:hypothetical protein [Empedobacter falsenii]